MVQDDRPDAIRNMSRDGDQVRVVDRNGRRRMFVTYAGTGTSETSDKNSETHGADRGEFSSLKLDKQSHENNSYDIDPLTHQLVLKNSQSVGQSTNQYFDTTNNSGNISADNTLFFRTSTSYHMRRLNNSQISADHLMDKHVFEHSCFLAGNPPESYNKILL
jgi:hypothetical protein